MIEVMHRTMRLRSSFRYLVPFTVLRLAVVVGSLALLLHNNHEIVDLHSSFTTCITSPRHAARGVTFPHHSSWAVSQLWPPLHGR